MAADILLRTNSAKDCLVRLVVVRWNVGLQDLISIYIKSKVILDSIILRRNISHNNYVGKKHMRYLCLLFLSMVGVSNVINQEFGTSMFKFTT